MSARRSWKNPARAEIIAFDMKATKPGKIAKIGRVTSESVLKCTGKIWDQWIALLDKAGARTWTHQEIVAHLKTRYKQGPWWQQGVTLGYEIHIGRRVEGQNQKGQYSTAATRTFPLDKKAAWKLLSSPEGIAAWLEPLAPFQFKVGEVYEVDGGFYGQVRTLKAGERVRLSWQEAHWPKAAVVQAHVIARPRGKSMIVIQQEGIADSKMHAQMRKHWKAAIARLLELAKVK
jgi:uncharacterized protein YndB with AHSA1/START domain